MRDINAVAGASTADVNPFGAHLPNNEATRAMIEQYPILASGAGYMGVFGSGNFYVFESSRLWVVPAGVTKIRRRVVGAGGSGGGGYVHDEIAVTPGETATITVGAGGYGVGTSSSFAFQSGSRTISATGNGGTGYLSAASVNGFVAAGGIGGGGGGGGSGSQLGKGGDGGGGYNGGNNGVGGGGGGVRYSAAPSGSAGASAWSQSGDNCYGLINADVSDIPMRFPFDHFLGGTKNTKTSTSIDRAGSGAGGTGGTYLYGGTSYVGGSGGHGGGGGGGISGGPGGYGGGGGGTFFYNGSGGAAGAGGPGLVIVEW